MAAVTTTTFSNQYQKYFSKKLLQYAVQALALDQFAQKAPLPKRAGNKDIRFFRYGAPVSTSVQTLTEGTPISAANYRVLSQSVVDATLVQYGQVIQLTDVLTMTEFFNSLSQATKTNGEDAALHADTIIRNELVANATTERFSGGATTFAALLALSAANGKMVASDALDAVTRLKINRAPRINGGYVGIVPPQCTRDLMASGDWLTAAQYSNVQALYKGEIGSLHGVRFIEATNPFIEDDIKGTYNATDSGTAGLIYSTIFTGAEAYGVPELTSQSPMSPQVIITDQPDKSDPLNQQINVGFKTFYVAKILNGNYFVLHRSKTTFA